MFKLRALLALLLMAGVADAGLISISGSRGAVSGGGSSWACAHTLNSPTAGSTDVSNTMTSAANGDCVVLPASSSATWTSTVTLSSSKFLTLDLNNSTITLSGAAGSLVVNPHVTGHNRVTNGSIVKNGTGYSDFNGPIKLNDTATGAAIRVDHVAFSYSGSGSIADGTLVDINGEGAGLLDHSSFSGMDDAYEFIHINAWGAGDTTGWTTAVDKGGAGLFYFEDNTCTGIGTSNNAWIQGYYGARVVFRKNTLNWCRIDAHGTPGNVGMRWWEIYLNTFAQSGHTFRTGCAINLRAGSGRVFLNTKSGSDGGGNVCMGEEDSGYPASYQIGRGTSQVLDPATAFSNTSFSLNLDDCECQNGPPSGMVTINRDVYAPTVGVRASRPGTCTTGQQYWSSDFGGNWDASNGTANDGTLDICVANAWVDGAYTPLPYPHSLTI